MLTFASIRGGLHRLLCQPANFVICPSYKLTYTRTFSNKQGSGAKSKSKIKIKNSGVRGSGKKCSLKEKERNILQYIEMRINYWFSDENLADDNYMRKKMLENGGWMSLKDLCSFPLFKKEKIKQETIAKALANSSHLELGCPREGNAITSMRRIDLDLSSASTWEDISNKKSEKEKQRNVFRSLAKYNHGRKVHISNTIKKVNSAMKRIQEEAYKNENKHGGAVISFDVENATIVQHGPRLPAVLLFCVGRNVDIVQLDKLPDRGLNLMTVPTGILDVLKDPKIIKVGNGVVKDAKVLLDSWRNFDNHLNHDYADDQAYSNHPRQPNMFCISGLVELETFLTYNERDRINREMMNQDNNSHSLQVLCQVLLKKQLLKKKLKGSKGSKISKISHWRAKEFTKEMIKYAAEDASVGLDLYNHIIEKRSPARIKEIFDASTTLPLFSNDRVRGGNETTRSSASALDELATLVEDLHKNDDDDDDDNELVLVDTTTTTTTKSTHEVVSIKPDGDKEGLYV